MGRKTPNLLVLLLFLLLLGFPYWILLFQLKGLHAVESEDLLWALKNSFIQSVGSGLLALLGGVAIAFGLGFFKARWVKLIQFACLLPLLLPPLFILLVFLGWVPIFPRNNLGVIFIQGFLASGYVGIILWQAMQNQLSGLAQTAHVFGSTQVKFLKTAAALLKSEILSLFLFVFVFSFSSFSIPLAMGGGRGTNLEILIYEKIKIEQDWEQAFTLACLQLVFIFVLSFLLFSNSAPKLKSVETHPFLRHGLGLFFLAGYVLFFVGGLVLQSFDSIERISSVPGLWPLILQAIPTSLGYSLAVGLVTGIFLLLAGFWFPEPLLHRMIRGFTTPSTALVGLSVILLGAFSGPANFVFYVIGIACLSFAGLYRMGWESSLQDLKAQITVAKSLGASRWLILKKITLPQVSPQLARICSLASLWALGDFALGKMVIGNQSILSLIAESLMTSYRIEAALGVSLVILALSGTVFLFYQGIEYVYRRKYL